VRYARKVGILEMTANMIWRSDWYNANWTV